MKLKQCPFCGESARVYAVEFTGYLVGCQNCDASLDGFETKEDAATAWNGRAECRNGQVLYELTRLVSLLEPLEQDGSLNVPGLATLNGPRAAIAAAKERST